MDDDRRARLIVLRDQLAVAIADAHVSGAPGLPQLAAQYRATLVELDAEQSAVPAPVSKRDELRERRENRSTTTSFVEPAERQG